MNRILEVKNATKKFAGLTANEDVTFHVNQGEILGIVGPNGAGKTTLFNAISGMFSLTSGQIIFDGIDITKKKAFEICKMGMGRTFQIPQSLDAMTVFDNILLGAFCRYNDILEAQNYADAVLELCNMTKFRNMLAGELNVIQKKRLEIGRAVATQPKLLLLDETMAGLTGVERKEAIDLILKLNKTGITIMTIEHVMEVVMTVSNRVVVLNTGKLLFEGTPVEVVCNEEVISVYLGGS